MGGLEVVWQKMAVVYSCFAGGLFVDSEHSSVTGLGGVEKGLVKSHVMLCFFKGGGL